MIECAKELFENEEEIVIFGYNGIHFETKDGKELEIPYSEIEKENKKFLKLNGDDSVEETTFGIVHDVKEVMKGIEKAKELLLANKFLSSAKISIDMDCFDSLGERVSYFQNPYLEVIRYTDTSWGLEVFCESKYDSSFIVRGDLI